MLLADAMLPSGSRYKIVLCPRKCTGSQEGGVSKRGLESANGVGIYFSLIANIGLMLGKQSEFINGERDGKKERVCGNP